MLVSFIEVMNRTAEIVAYVQQRLTDQCHTYSGKREFGPVTYWAVDHQGGLVSW